VEETEVAEKTTNQSQVADKLDDIMLYRVQQWPKQLLFLLKSTKSRSSISRMSSVTSMPYLYSNFTIAVYSIRKHLFCTCYKWNDSRIIIFHLLLSDYYDKRKRLCPSRRMDIMQLWTFIQINIRIYRSNIYDIYRGQSRGKYHETVINVL
jgi:hypothetical protein